MTYQNEGPVVLWKTDGTKISELTDKGQDYQLVNFSPDGQMLALLSQAALQLWDATTGKLITEFEHSAAFKTLAFSSDSQRLAVSTTDSLVHIWKQTEPQLFATLAGHTNQVDFLEFSFDNQQLFTVSKNETVIRRLKELKDLETLTDRACKQVQAYLVTHPEKLEKLEICQNDAIKTAAAPAWERRGKSLMAEGNEEDALKAFRKADRWQKLELTPEEKAQKASLINQGKELAAKGEVTAAVSKYDQALKLDPMDASLNFESELRTNELAAEALIKEGDDLIAANNMSAAVEKFEQALELSPDSLKTEADLYANQKMASLLLDKARNLMWDGDEAEISDSLDLHAEAVSLDPDITVTYFDYIDFCASGSIYGLAEKVLGLCEHAVKLTPDFQKHWPRSFRGLARAQIGDTNGALSDWEFVLKSEDALDDYPEYFNNASDWVETLQKGENPFTPEVLAELKRLW
ncbi:hypothetical protein QGP82_04660 [Leptothoe sp. LEGE 181152]|uniref:hypothetical protein n=1 Tax=Adonisia turfae TaxID=2950184 RepID=UPI0013D7531E|nr:hypothetical protein [Adonisia turfae]MDV3347970.1 hypothetical protein [Leptothoe sp. LEGE 181152]